MMVLYKNKAFSYIEILIVIFLIVASLSSFMYLVNNSLKLTYILKSNLGAVVIAQEHFENLRSMSYQNITSSNIASPQTKVLNGITYTIYTNIENIDNALDGTGASDLDGSVDYKKVDVKIIWQEGKEEKEALFSTIFSSP